MGKWLTVLEVSELTDGTMKAVSAEGHDILIAQAGQEYYAAENHCPHMNALLSQGKLSGTIITCYRHSSQFDLKDGHVVRWTNWSGVVVALAKVFKPPNPLRIYPTKSDGHQILVEF